MYQVSKVAYVDFLHHPTFPREATRGDFFAVWPRVFLAAVESNFILFPLSSELSRRIDHYIRTWDKDTPRCYRYEPIQPQSIALLERS